MRTYKLYCAGFIQDTPNAAYTINEDGSMTSFIFDKANTDYQAYLAWVSDGNQPLPSDETNANS